MSTVTTKAINTGFSPTEAYTTFASFPASGSDGVIYLDTASADIYLWNVSSYELQTGGGGGGATTALDNLVSTAVNDSIIPATNGSIDLGTSLKRWLTGYFQGLRVTSIQGNSSQITFSNNTSGGDFNFYANINHYADSVNNAIRMWEDTETEYVGFSVDPSVVTTDYVLPPSDGSSGQFLQTDGAGALSWGSAAAGTAWGDVTGTLSSQTDLQAALDARDLVYDRTFNLDRETYFETDFMQNDRAGLSVASNAGGGSGQVNSNDSTTGVNLTENCVGVYEMILGSGVTARACLNNSGQMIFGAAKYEYGARVALSSGLSDGTNTFTAYIGFGDNPGAGDITDGAYFRYTHSVNGGRWEAVVADAGARTAADTGVSPTSTVNQEFKIVVNQAGTEAQFYIDGSLTNTVSSGLPGVGDYTFYLNKIEKSAGTSSRSMAVDWLYLKTTRTSSR